MAKESQYYFCPCESKDLSTNPAFKHYFRLYKKHPDGDKLVAQGCETGLTDSWESKYGAVFNPNSPYPLLD
jgi:hypothetical protein